MNIWKQTSSYITSCFGKLIHKVGVVYHIITMKGIRQIEGGRVNEVSMPIKFGIIFLSYLMKIWNKTLKLIPQDEAVERLFTTPGVVAAMWHNRVFLYPFLLSHYKHDGGLCGLVSPSKDGAMVAAFLECFGIKCIRGSSSSRAIRAMTEVIEELKKGSSLGLTPDGPRGPRYEAKKGALMAAEKSGAKIVLINAIPRSYWTLHTWDRMMIPKPFSKVDVRVHIFENYAELEKIAAEKNMETIIYVEELLGDTP